MTTADRAVLLAPGASASRDHPSLVAVEDALRPDGVPVDRIDFPSRKAAAAVLGLVRDGAEALVARTGLADERIVLGGRSYGGRMCSMAVAEGLPALGLVLVSYPLHPPGRPEKARIEHLPRLAVPCLFVSGTRDSFGTRAELEAATATIPGPVTHVWIEGGDHGLRGRDAEVAAVVRDWVVGLDVP
ncbi:MAG TPA: alpha/beta family hydrolase [Acidimicrobiales bacterium]|nr:alpha/beta family hydrolase [Acidimicrobiales bacterium]